MRLSHWDFRPRRRRKYVTPGSGDGRSGSSRGWPTLRILLLAAFGILVYLKYDDFIRSPLIQGLRDPGKLWQEALIGFRSQDPLPSPFAKPNVYDDSTRWEWTCDSRRQDSCLAAWTGLDSIDRGAVRAALLKVRVGFGIPEPDQFMVTFLRAAAAVTPPADGASLAPAGEDVRPFRVEQLHLRADRSVWTLAWSADSAGQGRWCRRASHGSSYQPPGTCLESPSPLPPLRPAPSPSLEPVRPPVLSFPVTARLPVRPVLGGKVIAPAAAGAGWVKLHHGGGLFSFYAGLDSLREGLRAGDRVSAEDTLGFASAADSGRPGGPDGRLRLRIERDGSPVDPQAFLGLGADSAGAAHGP